MAMEPNNSSYPSDSIGKRGGSTVVIIRSYNQFTSLCSIFFFCKPSAYCFGDHFKRGDLLVIPVRKKRYQRNSSNLFILHLSVTELVYRLLVFPVVIYLSVSGMEMKSIHYKLTYCFVRDMRSCHIRHSGCHSC